MAESGILHALNRKHKIPDKCEEKKQEMTNAHALNIYEVAAVFVILVTGIATSVIVLLFEIILQKVRRKKKSGH